ncbi:MAG: PQQ-binding-like beta-propeller repeat protein [Phycisphaeraceae bacterium]|nr:PQQ-binding-like beta-propeller repeat protein [Phycisphaeraceae bacterium]
MPRLSLPHRWTRAGLIALAGCVLLGGCSTGGILGGEPDAPPSGRGRLVVDDAAFARLGFRRDWTGFPVVSKGGSIRDVVASKDVILARESGSGVSALMGRSGELRWHTTLATPLTKFVSMRIGQYGNRPAALVSSESTLYIIDLESGALLQKQTFSRVVNSGPTIVDNLLIYGTASGEILAHTIFPGAKAWGHDLDGPIESGPVHKDGVVLGVAESGQMAFLEAHTGELITRRAIYRGATVDPAIGQDFLVVASRDQAVYAYEPATGRQVWRLPTPYPLTSQPVAHDGAVYLAIPERGMVALDEHTGREIWTNAEVTGVVIGVSRGRLLIYNGATAFLVGVATGDVEQRVDLPGVARLLTDSFVDGNLFAIGGTAGVAKFVTRY